LNASHPTHVTAAHIAAWRARWFSAPPADAPAPRIPLERVVWCCPGRALGHSPRLVCLVADVRQGLDRARMPEGELVTVAVAPCLEVHGHLEPVARWQVSDLAPLADLK